MKEDIFNVVVYSIAHRTLNSPMKRSIYLSITTSDCKWRISITVIWWTVWNEISTKTRYVFLHNVTLKRINFKGRILKIAVLTPFTTMFCPLIQPAAGLARNETTGAISSGWPNLLDGARLAMYLMALSGFPWRNRSVSVGPGEMVLTVMPRTPKSLARARDNCSMAPLVAM